MFFFCFSSKKTNNMKLLEQYCKYIYITSVFTVRLVFLFQSVFGISMFSFSDLPISYIHFLFVFLMVYNIIVIL